MAYIAPSRFMHSGPLHNLFTLFHVPQVHPYFQAFRAVENFHSLTFDSENLDIACWALHGGH